MARISFIRQSLIIQSDNAVEDSDLLGPGATFTNAPPYFDLETVLELCLIPIKIYIIAKSGEIITMDDNGNVASLMIENAWVSLPGCKSH